MNLILLLFILNLLRYVDSHYNSSTTIFKSKLGDLPNPCSCGKSYLLSKSNQNTVDNVIETEDKTTGGILTPYNVRHPWSAWIQVKYPPSTHPNLPKGISTLCSASIISSNLILTAAHCCATIIPLLLIDELSKSVTTFDGLTPIPVFGLISPVFKKIDMQLPIPSPVSTHQMTITTGDYDKSQSSAINLVRKNHTVERILMHHEFRWETLNKDICLVWLKRDPKYPLKPPIDTTIPQVGPVCLPWNKPDISIIDTANILLAGWGTIQNPDTLVISLPKVEHYIYVKFYDKVKCGKDFLKKFGVNFLTGSMSCTLGLNDCKYYGDSCHGDSGGAYVYLDPLNGRYYAYCIVSWGTHCEIDRRQDPSGCTSVVKMLPWIKQNTPDQTFCKA